jgi:hypothetical protein
MEECPTLCRDPPFGPHSHGAGQSLQR